MANCIGRNKNDMSDVEANSYKPGFLINYQSSTSSNSLATSTGQFLNPSSSYDGKTIMGAQETTWQTTPIKDTSFLIEKVIPHSSSKRRLLGPMSVRDRCRTSITGCNNMFNVEGHSDKSLFSQAQSLNSTLVIDKCKGIERYGTTFSTYDLKQEQSVLPQRRSLNPPLVTERCRIGIEGRSGTFSLEGHSEYKSLLLRKSRKL